MFDTLMELIGKVFFAFYALFLLSVLLFILFCVWLMISQIVAGF